MHGQAGSLPLFAGHELARTRRARHDHGVSTMPWRFATRRHSQHGGCSLLTGNCGDRRRSVTGGTGSDASRNPSSFVPTHY